MFERLLDLVSRLPEAASHWADLPSLPKLRLKQETKDEARDFYSLELEWWDEYDKRWRPAFITLRHLADPLVDMAITDTWLFGIEQENPYLKMFDAVTSFPWVVLTLPIALPLKGVDLWLRRLERQHGISRHAHFLIADLGLECEPEGKCLLTLALRNLWQGRSTATCPRAR